jgi:hypothetical protein
MAPMANNPCWTAMRIEAAPSRYLNSREKGALKIMDFSIWYIVQIVKDSENGERVCGKSKASTFDRYPIPYWLDDFCIA